MRGGLNSRHAIAIHDVAPSYMDEVAELRDIIAQHTDGPVALLLIPRHRGDPRWSTWARIWLAEALAGGDEPVLHGCTHATAIPDDERELRGLSAAALRARLEMGLNDLAALGIRPTGLIAPCYATPPGAEGVLIAAGITWWGDRRRLRSASATVDAPAIGLGASTAPRRLVTPTLARLALRSLRGHARVRIDLHPADLRPPRLRRAALDLIGEAVVHHGPTVPHVDLLPRGAAVPLTPASGLRPQHARIPRRLSASPSCSA